MTDNSSQLAAVLLSLRDNIDFVRRNGAPEMQAILHKMNRLVNDLEMIDTSSFHHLITPQKHLVDKELRTLSSSVATFSRAVQDAGPRSPSRRQKSLDVCAESGLKLACLVAMVIVPCEAEDADAQQLLPPGLDDRKKKLSFNIPYEQLQRHLPGAESPFSQYESVENQLNGLTNNFEELCLKLGAMEGWRLPPMSFEDHNNFATVMMAITNLLSMFSGHVITLNQSVQSHFDTPVPTGLHSITMEVMKESQRRSGEVVLLAKLITANKYIFSLQGATTKIQAGIERRFAAIKASRELERPATHSLRNKDRYDVFISHAGTDKYTVAGPLYRLLTRAGIKAFLDVDELRCSSATAPAHMVQAMEEARLGVFILSPQFAVRCWPMKELRRFLQRNADGAEGEKPGLLPIFYRLSVADTRFMFDDQERVRQITADDRSDFYSPRRQAECTTEQARTALQELSSFTGVESDPNGGGDRLSSAAVVEASFMQIQTFFNQGPP